MYGKVAVIREDWPASGLHGLDRGRFSGFRTLFMARLVTPGVGPLALDAHDALGPSRLVFDRP
jgi:hypothetical protein